MHRTKACEFNVNLTFLTIYATSKCTKNILEKYFVVEMKHAEKLSHVSLSPFMLPNCKQFVQFDSDLLRHNIKLFCLSSLSCFKYSSLAVFNSCFILNFSEAHVIQACLPAKPADKGWKSPLLFASWFGS